MILKGTQEKLKLSSLIQYSFIALPLGFLGFPIYILAPDFYAINYELSLSSLGICLLLIRLFDAIQDPIIGVISDRYRQYIILIMGLSSCVLVLSIYALFNTLLFPPLIRFAIFITLSVTAYSVLTINLNSKGSLWSSKESDQIKISSARECFTLVGLLIAVLLPNFLEKIIHKDRVYHWFTIVLLVLMILGFIKFYFWHRIYYRKFYHNIPTSFFYFNKLSSDSKKLFAIYFISMFASSIPAVLVIFFVRDLLGAVDYTGFFLVIYFASAAVFMPFWNYMSKKQGAYKSWFFSMVLAICSFVWAFFLTKGDVWQYGFICLFSGLALGGDLIFPSSIVANHIHCSKSENNASSYYGILNLLSKSSLAFASAISFFVLDYAAFKVGGKNSEVSLMGLSVAYAFIPCTIKMGAAFLLWNLLIKKIRKIHEDN